MPPINERHRTLLEARGFDIELLERMGIKSALERGPDWIAIPVYSGDRIVNTRYRTISGEKRFSQEPGGEQIFYNSNCLADETLKDAPLIITEGEMDCWSAVQAGFPKTVSVPNGAPAEPAGETPAIRYQYLDWASGPLTRQKEIILAVDNDGPGINLLSDLSLRLGRARCKFVRYPRGCKDLNDALQAYGERGVTETLNRALWMQVSGLYRLLELPPLPVITPMKSGFPGLDDHYRLRVGDLAVVTGVPSHGKSSFVNDLVCRMAIKHKWPAALAAFEQIPQRDHRRLLRTWYNGKLERDQTAQEHAQADDWINQSFLFVVPGDNDEPSMDWIMERMATAVIRYGVKICVIDPWNEVEHIRPDGMTMTEYVGHSLRLLKQFARKYEVHMIVVAHPAKMRRDDRGKYPIPTLYDISDSAMFANRADVGVIIHRENADDNETLIRVSKSRYHEEIGYPGEFTVTYCRERGTYDLA